MMRYRRILPWVSAPILLLLFLGLWQVAISTTSISPTTLPAPRDVGKEIVRLLSTGELNADLVVTLTETVIGFVIAVVAGILVGTVLGRVQWLEVAMRPALVFFQVVPKVALIPLFVIWFGFGIGSKIVIAAILAFFPLMLNVLLGVRSVDRGHRDLMRSLRANKWETFRRLELPSTLPYVFTGMEVGVIFAIIGAIVGEYLGGNEGLGFQVVTSLNALDAPRLYAVIIVLAALGCLLYFAITGLKRLVIPWHESVNAVHG